MCLPIRRVFCCFCYSWKSGEGGGGGKGGWIVIVPFYQASFNNTLQDFGFFPITSHKTSHNSGEN